MQFVKSLGKYNKHSFDRTDIDVLSKWSWEITPGGYLKRTLSSNSKYKGTIYFHRLIMDAKPGEEVDHINGNPFDNQRSNLRIVTHEENMRNMAMHKDNKCGYKGVTYQKGKYIAHVWSGIKQVYLGRYKTAKEAAYVYDQVASQLFGSFARLNNIGVF